jgi:hypothetical protein
MKNDKYAAFTDAQLERKLREAVSPQERSDIFAELTARFEAFYSDLALHPAGNRQGPTNSIASRLWSATAAASRAIMRVLARLSRLSRRSRRNR